MNADVIEVWLFHWRWFDKQALWPCHTTTICRTYARRIRKFPKVPKTVAYADLETILQVWAYTYRIHNELERIYGVLAAYQERIHNLHVAYTNV